jgi:hypothetical protein
MGGPQPETLEAVLTAAGGAFDPGPAQAREGHVAVPANRPHIEARRGRMPRILGQSE